MKKTLLLLTITALLSACSSPHPELSAAPGKCYVETVNSLFVEAHIRSIDGGRDLFVDNESGDKGWIAPGVHQLIVVCQAEVPWSKLTEDVTVDVEFNKGYRYEIRTAFDGKTPTVLIEEIPHLTHGFFWTR